MADELLRRKPALAV